MKVLFVNIKDPNKQGDLMEVMALHGLKTILGKNCLDYPKKAIIYGDFSKNSKESLHGYGFSLYRNPLKDKDRINVEECDVVLHGFVNKNGYVNDSYPELSNLNKPIFYIDGHDDGDVVVKPCFKHECHQLEDGVTPLNLGIPEEIIQPINFEKTKLYPESTPSYALFGPQILGLAARSAYKFTNENLYYKDLAESFIGLSCRRGSWDALRNYEIMAAGTLLLIRDYNFKPPYCSPMDLPTISYSSKEELDSIKSTLISSSGVTQKYIDLLIKQREWLFKYGTTKAMAIKILEKLNDII